MGVQLKQHLWMAWATIAVKHEAAARERRADVLAAVDRGDDPAQYLVDEFEPSLIGITAAALALDGLEGDVQPIIQRKTKTKYQYEGILETLAKGFSVDTKRRAWLSEFKWLFRVARNPAVHHEPRFTAAPHPAIPVMTSAEAAFYCVENCTRAVDLLMEVLTTCVANPTNVTKQWADSATRAVDDRLILRDELKR